jgi:hypothetical protein
VRRLPLTNTLRLGNYPRMHLMPNGSVLTCGPQTKTALFNPARHNWRRLPSSRHGTRWEGTSALLPGGQRVLIVGGGEDRHDRTPTGTAELLNLEAKDPAWRFTGSLRHRRFLHNLVLLPDGKALAVGGGTTARYENPIFFPEMYDPKTGTWTVMAAQTASRMYHSTALLLPDGRIFSAGQTRGRFAHYGEIYSPPYLFRGTELAVRPVVSDVPARVPLGGRLQFSSPDAASIGKITLMRPCSVTHGNDTEQRAVPLQFSVSGDTVNARVPGNPNLVPPGYYMLFALNRAGVPAEAPWVRLV